MQQLVHHRFVGLLGVTVVLLFGGSAFALLAKAVVSTWIVVTAVVIGVGFE